MIKKHFLLFTALLILVLATVGCTSEKKGQSDIYDRISGYWISPLPGGSNYFLIGSWFDDELYTSYIVTNPSILDVEEMEAGSFIIDEKAGTVTFYPNDSRDAYTYSFKLNPAADVLTMNGIEYERDDDIDEYTE